MGNKTPNRKCLSLCVSLCLCLSLSVSSPLPGYSDFKINNSIFQGYINSVNAKESLGDSVKPTHSFDLCSCTAMIDSESNLKIWFPVSLRTRSGLASKKPQPDVHKVPNTRVYYKISVVIKSESAFSLSI